MIYVLHGSNTLFLQDFEGDPFIRLLVQSFVHFGEVAGTDHITNIKVLDTGLFFLVFPQICIGFAVVGSRLGSCVLLKKRIIDLRDAGQGLKVILNQLFYRDIELLRRFHSQVVEPELAGHFSVRHLAHAFLVR